MGQLGVKHDLGLDNWAVLLGVSCQIGELCSSRLGTLACSIRAERLMRNPWPSDSRVTAASVLSSVGVKPAPCRPKASAMVKHPACAAAISSSGLVPFSFSKRVLNE